METEAEIGGKLAKSPGVLEPSDARRQAWNRVPVQSPEETKPFDTLIFLDFWLPEL